MLTALFSGQRSVYGLYEESRDILIIRKDFNNRFFLIWDKGFRDYQAGNWKNARKYFKETLNYCKHNQAPYQTDPPIHCSRTWIIATGPRRRSGKGYANSTRNKT